MQKKLKTNWIFWGTPSASQAFCKCLAKQRCRRSSKQIGFFGDPTGHPPTRPCRGIFRAKSRCYTADEIWTRDLPLTWSFLTTTQHTNMGPYPVFILLVLHYIKRKLLF
jgi:hypothetical protein